MTGEGACAVCKKALTHDEIAITRKLINRGATEFMCMDCLAAHFSISRADVEKLIQNFKAAGCSLFF